MTDDEPLEAYSIELADTRPTMAWIPYLGEVPLGIGVLLFVSAGICVSQLGLFYALWTPAAWFGIGRLVALDYHALTRVQRWYETSMWNLDGARHRGVSVSPMPQRPKIPRGMGSTPGFT